ncbi:MAG: hypothetical protein M5U28_49395 [Sandaracinaceae bacterium]|nr:hypothetical protein [Sandaracinaceae bacterium]
MIKTLFLFAPNDDPRQRMNDVRLGALVQIGRPAPQPLVELMRGSNEDANRIAQNYVRAVTQRAPGGGRPDGPAQRGDRGGVLLARTVSACATPSPPCSSRSRRSPPWPRTPRRWTSRTGRPTAAR